MLEARKARTDQGPRPEDCLAGGGEMGALMRSLDWSRTPVGPVAAWPQSLRTAVSILLESRFPMYIAWGREYVQFYNDGYRPILGATKHPAAMGRTTPETFPEIWPIIGPMFSDVLRGVACGFEDLLLPLERYGYLEECYFTFSYSPIRDESGGVGGVHVTVTETTARVLGERRLRTLRDLAARAAEANKEHRAWESAAQVLADNPRDLPFALLYALDRKGETARRVGACGLAGDDRAAPAVVRLTDGDGDGGGWPLAAVARGGGATELDDLAERFGELPGGEWTEAPRSALVLPVTRPGRALPYGLLVAGASPRRALDDAYRDFFSLVADQVATAVANARAYEEERQRAEALAEIDRAKTVFFSNVSHEFRTPLTLLLGPLDDLLAGRSGPLPPAPREQIELAQRNGLRLLKLVNTLLDFSRIEAGRIEAQYRPTDLARLTAELASVFRSAVERAGLSLVVDCPPLPEPVYVDREMWEKIVLNLLSNAFKFTFEGQIAVRLRWTGEAAELTVSDTGVGVPADELPRLFERFHRVQGTKARTHEGSGIGLALVAELVRLHGGAVEAKSSPGEGSAFTVTLPGGCEHLPVEHIDSRRRLASTAVGAAPFVEEALRWLPVETVEEDSPVSPGPVDAAAAGVLPGQVPPAEGPGAEHPAQPPTAETADPLGKDCRPRILLADDNSDMREYLRRLLADHWRVEAVEDGDRALAAALAGPPDLVLTDVMMPGLDGFELLRRLRADERTRALPVLLLSARAGEESRIEGLEAGADDYLVKPFSARELVARVRTHLQLSALRRELDLERQRLRSFLMQAPAIITATRGPEHVVELSNPMHQQTVAGRDVVGKPIREALPELADSGAFEIMDEVYASGVEKVVRGFPARLEQEDGSLAQRFFDWASVPLRDLHGQVEGIMVLAYDVTEQVLARQEAEAASRAKDEFLAMLGHELRNPLSPILTALELMRLRGDGVLVKERNLIERQVDHLRRLVDDLLDVSRITQGKVVLRRRPIELAEVVAKAIETSSPLLESRRHRLHAEVPSRGLRVEADPARLTQVVTNLLTNAAKYTDPGGEIVIEAHRDGGMAVLRVRDSGIGIDPELMPRLFELFAQGRRTLDRAQGGLGLGLTLVRSLVELHGGTVGVRSEGIGKGSEFEVRMPATEKVANEEMPLLSAARASSPRRVLVVDDNRDAAEALAEALRLCGYEVREATDGPAALQMATTFRPSVALIDIGLPLMDGYEVARRLRELPGLGSLPLIAITGYGQVTDRERALRAGFHEHLVKPVNLERVVAAVEELVQDS